MKRVAILLLTMLCVLAIAGHNKVKAASLGGYQINSYFVKIIINEDNSFSITETLSVEYFEARQGIYRNIPLRNTIERNDGTKSTNRARITNVNVYGDSFKTSRENGELVIRIGTEGKYITGVKEYIISYDYAIGKDPLKDFDEFYYNIIPLEFDAKIMFSAFEIIFPKEFPTNNFGIYHGPNGSTNSEGIDVEISQDLGSNIFMISGSYSDPLAPKEGISIRLVLPEGYFTSSFRTEEIMLIICVVIGTLIIVLCFIFLLRNGEKRKAVEVLEFYPPNGLNSLDIAFYYKGMVGSHDVSSLLIYLADKGYLSITDKDKRPEDEREKGFKITKLKEYRSDNDDEREFFEALFDARDEVSEEDLRNKFYLTIKRISSSKNSSSNIDKIYDKNSVKKRRKLVVFPLISLLLGLLWPLLNYYSFSAELFPSFIFPFIGFMILIIGLGAVKEIIIKVFLTIFGLVFGGVPFVFMSLPAFLYTKYAFFEIGILLVASLFSMYVFGKCKKRTDFGFEMLERISGFKRFLLTAEKEKLETLVLENPSYFYDILPYTYVLGISKKWIKQFESIAIEPPTWYDYAGNYYSIHSLLHTINKTTSAATSSPSSSSSGGGFSSGGGSSGGGSGGGGGGSW